MEALTFTELLVGIAIAMLTHYLWTQRHIYRFAAAYPSTIWGVPPFGTFVYIRSFRNISSYLRRHWRQQKARTSLFFLGMMPCLVVAEPAVIEQVLTQPAFLEKSKALYAPVKAALNGGMIATSGPESLRTRKLFAPVFRHKRLLALLPTFNEKSKELLARLDVVFERSGSTDALLDIMHAFTLNVARTTTMGHFEESFLKDETRFIRDMLFTFRHTIFQIMLNCVNLFFLIKLDLYHRYVKGRLYSYTNELIKYRQQSEPERVHNNNNNNNNNNDDNNSKESTSKSPPNEESESYLFIDQALKHHRNGEITWDAMVGESNGMLVASYETTSSTLYSALLMLAMHPTVQERLYEELLPVYPDPAKVYVDYEHFKELPYLDMVVNETLRLFPAAPLIARQTCGETVLRIEGRDFAVPKDMNILIDIIQVQREPEIWGPDAEQFNPDHFLPQNVAARNAYAFVPFSKGPRICFGWTYAYFVMKVALVQALRQYRFSTDTKYEDVRVMTSVFLEYDMPRPPVLRLKRR